TSSPARATIVSADWQEAPPKKKSSSSSSRRKTASSSSSSPSSRRKTAAAAAAGAAAAAAAGATGFDLAPPLPQLPRPQTVWPKGTLAMQSGIPDVRLLPVDEIARAYRRALRRHGKTLLGYNDERGHPALRSALASMLATRRGMAVQADDVVV